MTDKLTLYNMALRHMGERKLASLTEDREPRYILDDVWDAGAVDYCLSQGMWNFATHTMSLDPTPSVAPAFGYKQAYQKPTDWLRTTAIASDEYFYVPLTSFADEEGYWFSDFNHIYVKFTSNGALYGGNLAGWSQPFTHYVSRYLAWQAAPRITTSKVSVAELKKGVDEAEFDAKAFDGCGRPTAWFPRGSWVDARMRGRSYTRDRSRRL